MKIFPLLALVTASACTQIGLAPPSASDDIAAIGRSNPQGADPGTCWDKTETPAIIQTVTENVLVQPAQISSTGTIQSPPIYRQRNRQIIVQERQERWFQLVCAKDLTPEFVSSVQRALLARDLYIGPITGQLNQVTRNAIKAYQLAEMVSAKDHSVLTIEGARNLGLWAIERTDGVSQ